MIDVVKAKDDNGCGTSLGGERGTLGARQNFLRARRVFQNETENIV